MFKHTYKDITCHDNEGADMWVGVNVLTCTCATVQLKESAGALCKSCLHRKLVLPSILDEWYSLSDMYFKYERTQNIITHINLWIAASTGCLR